MAEPISMEKHIPIPIKHVPTGNKSIRTPEQLLVLGKAREKAIQVRKFNATVKKAEKDMVLIEKLNVKKSIIAKHKELLDPTVLPPVEPNAVPQAEPKAVPPAKELKKKVKVVEVSDSEEEEEIVYIKKAKKPKAKPKIVYISDDDEPEPPPPPVQKKLKLIAFKNQLTSF
jgi:hypothetical protein